MHYTGLIRLEMLKIHNQVYNLAHARNRYVYTLDGFLHLHVRISCSLIRTAKDIAALLLESV